jgi:hypothetical protein
MRGMWAFSVLILLAGLLAAYPSGPLIAEFQGTEIIFDPDPSPFMGESSPNNNCFTNGPWDRWHDACNNRLVKGI